MYESETEVSKIITKLLLFPSGSDVPACNYRNERAQNGGRGRLRQQLPFFSFSL
jgi:hypothetical protein